MGGAPGAGGSSAGGRTGSGGSGMGGAPGADGGMGGAGGCRGVYCDNFESYTLGAVPPTWTRFQGSAGDFAVATDVTNVLAQIKNSSTFRAIYTTGVTGAPWSGATSVSARVKITAPGSSGTNTAMVCVRYIAMNNVGYCLALLVGSGAQIQVRSGGSASTTTGDSSAIFPASIVVGTAYDVRLSIDGAGLLSASLGGTALGALTPATTTAVASGFVALATQSAVTDFDDLVVTQP